MPELVTLRRPPFLDLDLTHSPSNHPEPVFPVELWMLVARYLSRRTRLALTATCKTLRVLLPPKFECVTLTLVDSSMGLEDQANQSLLQKIDFFTSPKIAPAIKLCHINFHTKKTPSLPSTPDICAPLFSALAHFKNLTDLDCFRILFDEHHVAIVRSLSHLTRAEYTECQWVHRLPIPFENRMRLHHLLVDHGPNKHRYNWLFNTHPDYLVSLVLTSGMPADFISGFLPPLPNLESLEINGIAVLHPEFPAFLCLCPGLVELRITTDALLPSYVRATEDVMAVIPPDCIPDLRVYEGPAKFLAGLTRGRLVTHVGVYVCPLYMDAFTIRVGSAFKKQQVRSLKLRVPRLTGQMLALLSYFKAALAVELVVTNEDQPVESRQTYEDILATLDASIYPPPPDLEYLSIADERTIWGVPRESPWYKHQRQLLDPSSPSSPSSSPSTIKNKNPPSSAFINRCPNLRYVMLSNDSGVISVWNPQMQNHHAEIKTIRQWQRERLGLSNPAPYHLF